MHDRTDLALLFDQSEREASVFLRSRISTLQLIEVWSRIDREAAEIVNSFIISSDREAVNIPGGDIINTPCRSDTLGDRTAHPPDPACTQVWSG